MVLGAPWITSVLYGDRTPGYTQHSLLCHQPESQLTPDLLLSPSWGGGVGEERPPGKQPEGGAHPGPAGMYS